MAGQYFGLWESKNGKGYSGKVECPCCNEISWINLYENSNENPKAPRYKVLLNAAGKQESPKSPITQKPHQQKHFEYPQKPEEEYPF